MGPAELVAFVLLLQHSLAAALLHQNVGSKECPMDSHPSFALLASENGPVCGATLLNQDWVLTSAHCYQSRKQKIHFGMHNTKKLRGHEQVRENAGTFCYPDSPGTTTNSCANYTVDIMLIKLDTPVTYNEHIAPMALPDHDASVGEQCSRIAWGETEPSLESPSKVPVCASINTMEKHFCQAASTVMNIKDNMLCAGALRGGTVAGNGDSGGHLVCDGQIQGTELVTIVNMSSMYVRIYNYLAWIRSIIGPGSQPGQFS